MLLISPSIRFIEELGSGGFGSVYLAEAETDSGYRQRLAVKILNKKMARVQDIVARQRDEARLLGMLNHDNIVKVYDLGEVNEQSAIFMEYVDGIDLHKLSQQMAIPNRVAILIGAAVASALNAAQTTRNPKTNEPLAVIHRDIKPANILLSSTGVPKVLDFGIARGNFDREGKTRSKLFGTSRYMAPEQLLYGMQKPSADIFALGLTLWDLIEQKPRERLPLNELAFNSKVAKLLDSIREQSDLRCFVPILSKMLAFVPENRPVAENVELELLDLSDQMPGPNLIQFAKEKIFQIKTKQKKNLPKTTRSSNITIGGVEFIQSQSQPVNTSLKVTLIMIGSVFVGTFYALTTPDPPDAGIQAEPTTIITVQAPKKQELTNAHTAQPTESEKPENKIISVSGKVEKTEKIIPQKMTMSVDIVSLPAGKIILIDGIQIGRTPIQGFPIETGEHQITIRDPRTEQATVKKLFLESSNNSQIRLTFEDNQWQLQY